MGPPLAKVYRGNHLESFHSGSAVHPERSEGSPVRFAMILCSNDGPLESHRRSLAVFAARDKLKRNKLRGWGRPWRRSIAAIIWSTFTAEAQFIPSGARDLR